MDSARRRATWPTRAMQACSPGALHFPTCRTSPPRAPAREGCALPNNLPDGTPSQPGQDTQGCFGPEVGQQLAAVMGSLGPTDVEIGSVVSLGFGINGERDIVTYNQAIAPKVFIPNHTTAVAVESSSLEWLVDPNDYLRPLVFDPRDDRWRKHGGHHDD